jgi:hypothetical protein
VQGQTASLSESKLLQTQPFEVKIKSHIPGEVRYSLDGARPQTKYVQPIRIDKNTLIRWGVFRDDQLIGKIEQQEFLFREGITMPVVSIQTDPANLFDPNMGIMVAGNNQNYLQTGEDWERPGLVRYYDERGKLVFQQQTGLRLHGRAQRKMPQQSLRLLFQDEEGRNTWLRYPVFGEAGNRQYRSLVLRSGGGGVSNPMIREVVANNIVAQTNSEVTVALAKPVILLLNGEYWGLYFLTERFDEGYFEERFRIPAKGLAIVEVPLDNGEKRGEVIAASNRAEKSVEQYNELLKQARNCVECLSSNEVNKYADLKNLRDYLIFQLFFENADWPFNNTKAWRYQSLDNLQQKSDVIPELDGRFRWLLFDLDSGLGSGSKTEAEAMHLAANDPYKRLIDDRFPFRNLFYQPDFQLSYSRRLQQLTDKGLDRESLIRVVDQTVTMIETEMPYHIARWHSDAQNGEMSMPATMEVWKQNVAMMRSFLINRSTNFLGLTEAFFKSQD